MIKTVSRSLIIFISLLAFSCISTSRTKEQYKTIELTTSNSVIINNEINYATISTAMQDLAYINKHRKSEASPIFIVINSPGGSIMAGNAFIRLANTIPNVHTICMFCASMAHAISQGITGVRFALPDNIMMAHRAKGTFSGQFEDGEVESQLNVFKKVVRAMEQRNADRIGISLENYKLKVINEWWTHGEDSKKENIVDALVNIKCSQELIDTKRSIIIETPFGLAKGPLKSVCPLMI